MYLVHEKKHHDGKWEVNWMWLPHFLAADISLHKFVDQKMTDVFKGEMVPDDADALLKKMHLRVIDLIFEKYPFPGMKKFLDGYSFVSVDGE
jgi:hypothetical protein